MNLLLQLNIVEYFCGHKRFLCDLCTTKIISMKIFQSTVYSIGLIKVVTSYDIIDHVILFRSVTNV